MQQRHQKTTHAPSILRLPLLYRPAALSNVPCGASKRVAAAPAGMYLMAGGLFIAATTVAIYQPRWSERRAMPNQASCPVWEVLAAVDVVHALTAAALPPVRPAATCSPSQTLCCALYLLCLQDIADEVGKVEAAADGEIDVTLTAGTSTKG
jgi:hypothetical protein